MPQLILAVAGDLDFGFDFDGLIKTDLAAGRKDEATSVVMQPDGKIIVAGNASNGNNHDYLIARFNSDGSLDGSFGTAGIVAANFGAEDYCSSVALQADGKIIVAGSAYVGNNFDFALARYNSDGSPDFSFGFWGRVTIDFNGSDDSANAVIIQQNGKIVAAGSAKLNNAPQFALARFNSDGSLDSNFNGDGKVITSVGVFSVADDVIQQSDGKIVAVGNVTTNNNYDFAVVRYNLNGFPDPKFDSDGIVVTDFLGFDDAAYSIAQQNDGKLIVAGSGGYITSCFALVRYNPNGSIDQNFGSGGILLTPIGSSLSVINSVLVQPDGKIVAAGWGFSGVWWAFVMTRYNKDGSWDLNFGLYGEVITRIGNANDVLNDTMLQPDGKIVAVGVADKGFATQDFALARYHSDFSGPCTYCDHFVGDTLPIGWSYSKPHWSLNQGNLVGSPTANKTEAIATEFLGCDLCTVETSMSTEGGRGNKVSLLTWYTNPENYIEVIMSEETDRWLVRQHSGGRVVAKTKSRSPILPNSFYNVKVSSDGNEIRVTIDGVVLATLHAFGTPNGTVGFRVKNTTARFPFINVE
jgi:uncharacterized delta-60 repeat protein